ncbi:hypothetical protein ACFS7Z_02195 [Pontibacter toksunensis]|uniref:Uncharacterized protein n=1 Tax=Pontibacter toksunensis TaxID=1332631 RepID=A0ABW6BPH0_9BACT
MNCKPKPKFENKREIYESNIFIINNLLKNSSFKRIFNSLKFTCFFVNERIPFSVGYYLLHVKRILKHLIILKIYNNYKFNIEKKCTIAGSGKEFSYATINTNDAVHYEKLEAKLVELLNEEVLEKGKSLNQYSLITSKETFCYGRVTQFYIKLQALFILLIFVLKTFFLGNKEAKDLVFYDLEKLYINIAQYLLDFKYFVKILKLNPPDFVITVNENWMPQSVIIDCCRNLNIPTAIYPHGIIGSTITLPSECDIFLFWNEQMKNSFEKLTFDKNKNLVIGALEPIIENDNISNDLCYDLLIISQLSVANDNVNVAYKDIFFIWKSFIETHPNFKVCIKLHPFEGSKELIFLNEIFNRFLDQVTIVDNRAIPINTLIRKSKRISTVSSSAITYCFYLKKPVLLYNPPEALFKNFPILDYWVFKDIEGLEKLIENEDNNLKDLENHSYTWVQESVIKKNIALLVDEVIK